jgi:regulator of protease activity HflC (stomatin/prohibitin superfamily)
MIKLKILIATIIIFGYAFLANNIMNFQTEVMNEQFLNQMGSGRDSSLLVKQNIGYGCYVLGWIGSIFVSSLLFVGDFKSMIKKISTVLPVLLLLLTGCWRPFQPIKLETIQANETAFLIPLLGDAKKQQATHTEEFLSQNLVQTQQIQLPQQWVPAGYEYLGANGSWKDAAILIKVDRSPVTREWTADPNKGTSKKNEAIWVMTSDQVEFSTGWTCTAYIATREDAVKFLYYYRNGNLADVMDNEIRAKIQTSFGLEVTDLPMEKIRSAATPHIKHVVDEVSIFFKERGITITNLGITGGFIYTDATIQKTLVELFNAEQQQAIATATAAALQKTAQGKADAAKLQAEGEAEAIKTVADAKAYEIEKAEKDLATYVELKRLEIEVKKIEKWKGDFPASYIGNLPPESLLSIPSGKK